MIREAGVLGCVRRASLRTPRATACEASADRAALRRRACPGSASNRPSRHLTWRNCASERHESSERPWCMTPSRCWMCTLRRSHHARLLSAVRHPYEVPCTLSRPVVNGRRHAWRRRTGDRRQDSEAARRRRATAVHPAAPSTAHDCSASIDLTPGSPPPSADSLSRASATHPFGRGVRAIGINVPGRHPNRSHCTRAVASAERLAARPSACPALPEVGRVGRRAQ